MIEVELGVLPVLRRTGFARFAGQIKNTPYWQGVKSVRIGGIFGWIYFIVAISEFFGRKILLAPIWARLPASITVSSAFMSL